MSLRRVFGLAYSERYIAAPSPSGVAIIIAMTDTSIVPMKIVRTSNSPLRGRHPSAQSWPSSTFDKKVTALPASATMMATLTTIETIAAAIRRIRTNPSLRWRRGLP